MCFHYLVSTSKNIRHSSKWDYDYTVVASPNLVSFDAANAARRPTSATSKIKLLILPSNKRALHPLLSKMRLVAVRLSRKPSEGEIFQRRLQKLSQSCGYILLNRNMKQSLKNALCIIKKTRSYWYLCRKCAVILTWYLN